LNAQREAERIVGDYETLRRAAAALVEHSRDLGSPIVWPVGEAADRLAGAASLLAAGQLRTRAWTDDLLSAEVVVLAVADVTTFALAQAARHARALGAAQVYGCWVGFADMVAGSDLGFDSFSALTLGTGRSIAATRHPAAGAPPGLSSRSSA
jgi:hypothetical protein